MACKHVFPVNFQSCEHLTLNALAVVCAGKVKAAVQGVLWQRSLRIGPATLGGCSRVHWSRFASLTTPAVTRTSFARMQSRDHYVEKTPFQPFHALKSQPCAGQLYGPPAVHDAEPYAHYKRAIGVHQF